MSEIDNTYEKPTLGVPNEKSSHSGRTDQLYENFLCQETREERCRGLARADVQSDPTKYASKEWSAANGRSLDVKRALRTRFILLLFIALPALILSTGCVILELSFRTDTMKVLSDTKAFHEALKMEVNESKITSNSLQVRIDKIRDRINE